jgi:hypothetical protein
MNVYSFLLILILAAGAGCTQHKDRAALMRGVKTTQLQLDCKHTDLPSLLITVPSGFASDWTKEARYDKFFIFDPADTGEVQKGMILIDVTPAPPKQIPDSADYKKSLGTLNGEEVQWREMTFIEESDSSKVYQREMQTNAPYRSLSFVDKKMVIHAFVVGSDPKLVELLTACVETLKALPSKPNL